MVTDNFVKNRCRQKNHLRCNKTALGLIDTLIKEEPDKYKKEKLLAIRKEICKL